MFASILMACVSSYSLYVGYQKAQLGLFPENPEQIHNVGKELCTKHNDLHFSWYFPYDSLHGYRPMGFVWLLIAAFPHFFREDEINPKGKQNIFI
jgi:hypothetical protein